MKETLIDIQDLCIEFQTSAGTVHAVDHVSFDIKKGEVFALVGESGCGKSTTAMGIMQLIKKPGRIAGGAIHFDGKDLLKLSADEMTEVRGKKNRYHLPESSGFFESGLHCRLSDDRGPFS